MIPNMIHVIEEQLREKDKEIERLNNIINKGIEAINVYQNEKTLSVGYQDLKRIKGILRGNEFDLKIFEEYLQEVKGDGGNELDTGAIELNDDVEIIEEDKKIETLDLAWVEVLNFKEQAQQDCVEMVFNKINEIIDKINSMEVR